MAAASLARARTDIARLSHRGLAVREFSLGAGRILRHLVPSDGICVMTMDPATLLPTGHVIENGLPEEATRQLAEIELRGTDFNRFSELARRSRPAASLSRATGGKLDRSERQRELRRPHGFDDELRVTLATDSGTWGGVVLMRETDRPHFSDAEANHLASLSAALAEGLRRAILHGAPPAEDGELGPGLVLLAEDNTIELADPAAHRWLAELDTADGGRPPIVVHTVADRARANAAGTGADSIATARVRTQSGRWLTVRGSILGDEPDTHVAVILEPAQLPELAPLIADAFGLTPRERAITQLVAQGFSTSEISERLYLSPYTVQDHLKAIFEKTDVSSRGALVARLFFEQCVPRLAAGSRIGADGWFASDPPDGG